MTNKLGPYLLGPNDENQGIYIGDAKILAREIPDESVDLIFTDPEYDKIEDYEWLAKTATRVLKPNRACLTFCGIGYLPDTLEALQIGGLIYRWYVPHLTPGTGGYCDTGPSRQMAMLWLDNSGMTYPTPRLYDVVFTNGVIDWHIWRKNLGGVIRWINSFPGIIIDFFCGGGTMLAAAKMLGHPYLGFEINPETAELARHRIAQTQPPLFMPKPQQLEFSV